MYNSKDEIITKGIIYMSFSSDVKIELSELNNLKDKQEVYLELLRLFII